jgi:hypothetical protein
MFKNYLILSLVSVFNAFSYHVEFDSHKKHPVAEIVAPYPAPYYPNTHLAHAVSAVCESMGQENTPLWHAVSAICKDFFPGIENKTKKCEVRKDLISKKD